MEIEYITTAIKDGCNMGVITINGFHMKGRIVQFSPENGYIIILCEGAKKLVYTHAISTIYKL